MQLLRYLAAEGASLGVLRPARLFDGHGVAAPRRARRPPGGPGDVFEAAAWEPKALLALGACSARSSPRLSTATTARERGGRGRPGLLRLLAFVPNPGEDHRPGLQPQGALPTRGRRGAAVPAALRQAAVEHQRAARRRPRAALGRQGRLRGPSCASLSAAGEARRRAEALAYVGGYTVMNDLSAKILPRPKLEAQTTTLALKGVDGFAPLGAVIVTPGQGGQPERARDRLPRERRGAPALPGLGHGARRGG